MRDGMRNEVIMEGILQEAPEIRCNSNGDIVSIGRIGCRRASKDDVMPKTDYFNVVAWERNAQRLGQAMTGDVVSVKGRLINRSFTDKHGNKRTMPEIAVMEIINLGPEIK